jgi:hypothetical protein
MQASKQFKSKTGKFKKTSRDTSVVVRQGVSTHPPPYIAQSIRKLHLRAISSGAVTQGQFLYSELGALLGVIATSTVASVFWSSVFRITRIRLWGPVATAGTPVSCVITWNETSADFESPPITKSDTSVSFDYPAFIDAIPPRGSLASKWHGSAQTDTCFGLSYPSGTTVDFDFEFVLSDLNAPLAGPTLIAATLGTLYHKTVHSLVPLYLNSI